MPIARRHLASRDMVAQSQQTTSIILRLPLPPRTPKPAHTGREAPSGRTRGRYAPLLLKEAARMPSVKEVAIVRLPGHDELVRRQRRERHRHQLEVDFDDGCGAVAVLAAAGVLGAEIVLADGAVLAHGEEQVGTMFSDDALHGASVAADYMGAGFGGAIGGATLQ